MKKQFITGFNSAASLSIYKLISWFILLPLIITIHSCKDDPITPPPINEKLKYEWVVDTLFNPNGYGVIPQSMWGSSDSNIWIAGWNLAWQGEIFHYNGTKWIRKTPLLGFNYELKNIFGFSENNIYAVGSKRLYDRFESLILHYNGIDWQVEDTPYSHPINFIHGQSPDDMWACGTLGLLLHKTGGKWEKVDFSIREYLGPLSVNPNLGPIYVSPNGEVFLMSKYQNSWIVEDTAKFYFSKFNTFKGWQDIDSSILIINNGKPRNYKFGDKAMWGISEQEIYSAGRGGVYRFDGNSWELKGWSSYFYNDAKGISGSRVFAVGDRGVLQYGGNDRWQAIQDYYEYLVNFLCIMPFQDKIFIGAEAFGQGYVLKGKLKQ
jgi:hypothetical protein